MNTSTERAYAGRLKLGETEANSRWRDLLKDTVLVASGRALELEIPAKELRVLLREKSAGEK